MAFSRVLAAVTGSPADAGTVSHAADLVRQVRGRLYIAYVIEIDRSLPVDAEVSHDVERGEQILRRAEQLARLPKNEVEAELLQAREAGPAIVHEAVVRDVEAVVVGTQYPTELGAFSLGSDINYILENAPCHVILWREPRQGVSAHGARTRNRTAVRA